MKWSVGVLRAALAAAQKELGSPPDPPVKPHRQQAHLEPKTEMVETRYQFDGESFGSENCSGFGRAFTLQQAIEWAASNRVEPSEVEVDGAATGSYDGVEGSWPELVVRHLWSEKDEADRLNERDLRQADLDELYNQRLADYLCLHEQYSSLLANYKSRRRELLTGLLEAAAELLTEEMRTRQAPVSIEASWNAQNEPSLVVKLSKISDSEDREKSNGRLPRNLKWLGFDIRRG